jgi:hypothetical protein
VFSPTKNTPKTVVLNPPVYADVQTISKAKGFLMFSLVEYLIGDALETLEDIYLLVALAAKRKTSLKKSELVSHKRAWS